MTFTITSRGHIASALALSAIAFMVVALSNAHAQSLTIAPSGRATTEVAITPEKADASVKPMIVRIDYGQPHLRGRQLHTGDLVPYDQPWRLGANAPTTLTSDVDLVIGGARVSKGTYVLRALPARAGWKLLIEKDAGQAPPASGAEAKPPQAVASIDLKHTTLPAPLESFTMWLIPSTAAGPPRGEVRFAWGTTMLSTEWTTK